MKEWKTYKLEDLLSIPVRNGLTKPSSIRGKGVKMIGMGELFANEIIRDIEMPRVPTTDSELKLSAIEKGDLLFARQSLTLEGAGKCSLVKEVTEPTVFESHIIRCRVNKNLVTPEYLYYYFRSRFGRYKIECIVEQVAAAGIRGKDLIKIEIPVPDIQTQRGIVDCLSTLDEKIHYNSLINDNLEQQAQALYKSWFVDFDPFMGGEFVESEAGMIPKGWRVGNLLDVAELYDSRRKPLSGMQRSAMKKIYPYYGATSIMDYIDNYIFDGIYLLMGEDGSVVTDEGYPFLQYVSGKFWPNNHAHVMQGKNGFTTEMLHCFLLKKNISEIVTGAVQAKISQGNMKKISLVIAPDAILNEFTKILDGIYAKIRCVFSENLKLEIMRDSLLPKLMSGELKINEIDC